MVVKVKVVAIDPGGTLLAKGVAPYQHAGLALVRDAHRIAVRQSHHDTVEGRHLLRAALHVLLEIAQTGAYDGPVAGRAHAGEDERGQRIVGRQVLVVVQRQKAFKKLGQPHSISILRLPGVSGAMRII